MEDRDIDRNPLDIPGSRRIRKLRILCEFRSRKRVQSSCARWLCWRRKSSRSAANTKTPFL